MSRRRGRMALGLLLAAPVLLALTAFAQTATPATPHHKSHKTQKPVALPPLPSGPLSQLPMDQLPPTPAKVSYQGGLLTISAQNSTLGEILRDVRRLTGAAIEIPQNANERVVTHLGPGAPRDVLAGLLNGSGFNYVMVGSSLDPTAVSSVILMAKPSLSGEAAAQTQTAANVYQNNPVQIPPNGPPQPLPFGRRPRNLGLCNRRVPKPTMAAMIRVQMTRIAPTTAPTIRPSRSRATCTARRGRCKSPGSTATAGSEPAQRGAEDARADYGNAPQTTAARGRYASPTTAPAAAPAINHTPLGFRFLGFPRNTIAKGNTVVSTGRLRGRLVAAGVALVGYQCRKDVRRSSGVDGGQHPAKSAIRSKDTQNYS